MFALCASLFGDGPFLSKYVLGAVELAAALHPPWTLWITIDDAAMELWGAALRRVPNVHLVRMAAAVEMVGTEDVRHSRTRRSTTQLAPLGS